MVPLRRLPLRQKLPLMMSALTAGALIVAVALAYIEVRGTARSAAEARLRSVRIEILDLFAPGLETRRQTEEAVARSATVLEALRGATPDSVALADELAVLRTAADGNLPVLLVAADDRTVFT